MWITDHISWFKYRARREIAKVSILKNSAKQIRLELKSDTYSRLYDLPLTLVTQVPKTWTKCAIAQGETKSEAAVVDGQVRFEALPKGAPISLKSV